MSSRRKYPPARIPGLCWWPLGLLLALAPGLGPQVTRGQPPLLQLRTEARPSVAREGQRPEGEKQFLVPLQAPGKGITIEQHGEAVSLVVREAPLKEVLAVLAQTQGLNIVCGDDIQARVSTRLERVPLEDALDSIVSVAGCTWTRHRGIVYVTTMGQAAALAPQTQGRQVEVFALDYVSAMDADEAVKGLLSPAGKSFPLLSSSSDHQKAQEVLVVEDLPGYVQRIGQYLRQLDLPPRQVLIEARVLQVELSEEDRHGVNFNHLFQLSGNKMSLKASGFATPGAPQAFFAEVEGGNLDALIECLKTTTDIKTLASPKVLVINGQLARIQIGDQLGFRITTTTETSTQEGVGFLDVGVVLNVTPRVSRDGHVLMRVMPKVSSGQVHPETGLPQEETTEVETDVLLRDGQGMVIGGLIQEKDSDIQQKLPLLGDVPWFGKLFQKTQLVKSRTEIIIALVPRIVPYEPHYAVHEQQELQRTQTPLFHGPLQRCPRPWESSLPGPFQNPLLRLPSACDDPPGPSPALPGEECFEYPDGVPIGPPLPMLNPPLGDDRQEPEEVAPGERSVRLTRLPDPWPAASSSASEGSPATGLLMPPPP